MNLSKHVKVTRSEWEAWRQYLESSGYRLADSVSENGDVDVAVYDGEDVSADYALSRLRVDGQWRYLITIRIPRVSE